MPLCIGCVKKKQGNTEKVTLQLERVSGEEVLISSSLTP